MLAFEHCLWRAVYDLLNSDLDSNMPMHEQNLNDPNVESFGKFDD